MNRYRPLADGLSIFLVLAGLVSAAAVLWGGASASLQITIAQALIFVVATVGFYIFVGNSGVFSFGHVSFMMIGAYVGGILATPSSAKKVTQPDMPGFLASLHVGSFPAALLGGLVAAIAALVVSFALIRLSGLAASLTSFALLQIVYIVSANWQSVTNGESGLAAIPLLDNVSGLWIVAVAVIGLALVFQQSRWGRRLQASREDEVAARALGIDVHHERRVAFVLSAFVMGLAGAFYGQLLGALVPESLYLTATTQILIMLVVGGMTSLSGAVCGSLFVSAVTEVLRRVQLGVSVGGLHVKAPVGVQQVGLAVIMLGALLLFPRGLTASKEITWLARPLAAVGRRLPRRRAPGRAAAAQPELDPDAEPDLDRPVPASVGEPQHGAG